VCITDSRLLEIKAKTFWLVEHILHNISWYYRKFSAAD
jgi:hypothetical protein